MTSRRTSGAVLLVLLASCGGDPSGQRPPPGAPPSDSTPPGTDTALPPSCSGTPFAITIGQGNDTTFATGAIGDLLTLYYGPQGGWHVDAAALVAGVGPASTVDFRWKLTVVDEGWVVGDPEQAFFTALQPYDADTCAGNVYGALAFLDHLDVVPGANAFERGCALDGKPMRMDLGVTLMDGRSATASIEGVAAVDLGVIGDCPIR